MSGFEVGAGSSYTTKAFFRPDKEIGKGYKVIEMTIKSESTGEKLEFAVPVYMISLDAAQKQYLPNVKVDVDFPEKIDPRDELNLKVTLRNLNIKNISSLEVYVESDSINEYQLTSLEPEQERVINFPIQLDPLHPPEKDILKVKAITEPYEFTASRQEFEIIDYTSVFDKQEELTTSLFKKTKTIVYKNIGNVDKSQTVRVVAPIWKVFLFSVSPKDYSVVKEEGIRYYSWDLKLNPDEEQQIIVVTNYRVIFYFFLLIIIGFISYNMFRSPVQITKLAKNIELHKGVISEVKVMLNIKNISNKQLGNIKILDKIPNMANITQDFDIGTVKPSKIMKHESQGYTVVRWDLDELDPNEDRLITYRMKSRLSIFGNFDLPRAKVKYKTSAGKKRVVRSNKLVIHA